MVERYPKESGRHGWSAIILFIGCSKHCTIHCRASILGVGRYIIVAIQTNGVDRTRPILDLFSFLTDCPDHHADVIRDIENKVMVSVRGGVDFSRLPLEGSGDCNWCSILATVLVARPVHGSVLSSSRR
jgi:hypothetical protein